MRPRRSKFVQACRHIFIHAQFEAAVAKDPFGLTCEDCDPIVPLPRKSGSRRSAEIYGRPRFSGTRLDPTHRFH
jgi:hypothetical protein